MSAFMVQTISRQTDDIRENTYDTERDALIAFRSALSTKVFPALFFMGHRMKWYRYEFTGWRCTMIDGARVIITGKGDCLLSAMRDAVMQWHLGRDLIWEAKDSKEDAGIFMRTALIVAQMEADAAEAVRQSAPQRLEVAMDIRRAMEDSRRN